MKKMKHKCLSELAQIAMMLEVCAETKPGNVDRRHDYDDTWLEHFLASAILVKPAFEKAENFYEYSENFSSDSLFFSDSVSYTRSVDEKSPHIKNDNKINAPFFNIPSLAEDKKKGGLGSLIYEAVSLTNTHSGGNTHFGAFILLIPLIAGGGITGATKLVKSTSVFDAVLFYQAFSLTSVRMNDSDDMDVSDPKSVEILHEKKMTLYDVMEYSSKCDMVSNEWISGFKLTRKTADFLLNSGRGKNAIPDAYMKLLAENEDTFVAKKLGADASLWTMKTAGKVLSGEISVEEFDRICLSKGINPGSTADIIIAGIFIALIEGWKWDI